MTCAAAGFKTEVRRNTQIELNQKARLDFQLQVGQQTEMVEVSSSLPLLKTEDATLGSVVDSKKIVELPLNGRNFAQAAQNALSVYYVSQPVLESVIRSSAGFRYSPENQLGERAFRVDNSSTKKLYRLHVGDYANTWPCCQWLQHERKASMGPSNKYAPSCRAA